MAFGKADVGLIKADRAAQTIDPNLAMSAGIGNLLSGISKTYSDNQAAVAKANEGLNKEWDKITDESMSANNDLTRKQRKELKKLYKNGRKMFVNSGGGADGDEVADLFTNKMNTVNQIGAEQKMSQENGGNFGPGFDETDKHFSTAFSGGKYENVEVDGVTMVKIKNPDGYGGEDSDGYTYFNKQNLPRAMDQWTDGSTSILENWDADVTNNVNWEKNMTAGTFANKYKKSFPKKMNYFQAQDLISSDHSDDGIDNSFLSEFSKGSLPKSYYSDINDADGEENFITVTRDGKAVTYDPSLGPMGGLTKEELTGYIKGVDSNGNKDYTNMSKVNEFIKEKYSTFMGDVTKDAYDKTQKEKMEASNRYFNQPNANAEDGSGFSIMDGGSGTFPSSSAVTTQKKKVLKDTKFATATSAKMMSITGDGPEDVSQDQIEDWNKFKGWKDQLGDDGDLITNLNRTYGNYDDVEITSDDGVLAVVVDGKEEIYNFTDKNIDKNLLMRKLEEHLGRSSFNDYSELSTLNNDASTWSETLGSGNRSILQQLGEGDNITIKLRNMDRNSTEFREEVLNSSINGIAMEEKDVLQALGSGAGETFETKAQYKEYFMKNNGGLSVAVDEAQFEEAWGNYKIK